MLLLSGAGQLTEEFEGQSSADLAEAGGHFPTSLSLPPSFLPFRHNNVRSDNHFLSVNMLAISSTLHLLSLRLLKQAAPASTSSKWLPLQVTGSRAAAGWQHFQPDTSNCLAGTDSAGPLQEAGGYSCLIPIKSFTGCAFIDNSIHRI